VADYIHTHPYIRSSFDTAGLEEAATQTTGAIWTQDQLEQLRVRVQLISQL